MEITRQAGVAQGTFYVYFPDKRAVFAELVLGLGDELRRRIAAAEFVDEERYRGYYRRLAEGYTRGLARAIDAGRVRDLDPETLAHCLMGIADFLGMRWVLWEERDPPDHVLETAADFYSRGMATKGFEKGRRHEGGDGDDQAAGDQSAGGGAA